MDQNQELEKLKSENAQLRTYINPLKIKETEQKNQMELYQMIFKEGGQLVKEFNSKKNELEVHKIELETKKLKTIEKIDSKEKVYKGVLILTCIGAVLFSASYIDKSEAIIPVLTLIIGLLFKSNSFADFLKHSSRKGNNSDISDE